MHKDKSNVYKCIYIHLYIYTYIYIYIYIYACVCVSVQPPIINQLESQLYVIYLTTPVQNRFIIIMSHCRHGSPRHPLATHLYRTLLP